MDIILNGMTPKAAAEKAFNGSKEIFAKSPIPQADQDGDAAQRSMIFGPVSLPRSVFAQG